MILVFGGTTEGRKAVEVLEEAGKCYYYSTKTGEQNVTLHHGVRIDGALDADAMRRFCRQHAIRLMVDAAHPFAVRLHQTVNDVAREAAIPVIRYDRIYPPRDPSLEWVDDYSQVPADMRTLLATTGVQSIGRLKHVEAAGVKVCYRILRRASSVRLAHELGATDDQLVYYDGSDTIDTDADAILLKESGLSGGFVEKVEAARRRGMRIIVLKRPPQCSTFNAQCPTANVQCSMFNVQCQTANVQCSMFNVQCSIVNGPHGLRRAIERLLPDFFPLHSGLTTGTCATAAAIAATRRRLYGESPSEVPVLLPNGETIPVAVGYGDGYACCVKEAGDDPDVTDGIEVRAEVKAARLAHGSILNPQCPMSNVQCSMFNLQSSMSNVQCSMSNVQCSMFNVQSSMFNVQCSIFIEGGRGVGRFTLPGFDFPPGEAAINRGPRQMIRENLAPLLQGTPAASGEAFTVIVSVPDGEAIAQKTFNPRLGIEGGISIIGSSGIVKPFSEEAFVDSIRKCMQVAKASGAQRVVINSGAKSERFVRDCYPDLPQQAFVQYGNFIGATLRMAHELAIGQVTLCVMLGKAVKLAAGHLDTHSKKTTFDIGFIRQMLAEADISTDISGITLARELWERLPADKLDDFAATVISHCLEHCQPLLPDGELTILLVDDHGKIYPSSKL